MAFNPQTGEYEQEMVADPANVPAANPFGFDPGQATRDYLAGVANPQTLTALLGAEAAARPQFGGLGLKDIAQYTQGTPTFDVQAFLAANPDIAANYRNSPEDYGRIYGSLENYALADAQAKGVVDQFSTKTGGSLDLLKQAGGVASGVETAANTALRTAGAADVAALAPQLAATYNQINPEVLGSLKRAEALQGGADQYAGMRSAIQNARQFGDLQFNPAQASLLGAAPQVGLGGYNAAQALAQGYQAQGYTPQGYQAAQAGAGMQTEAERLARGQLGQALYTQALQAGPSQAAQILGGRAAEFAGSTGQLSPEELRNVQQATREAYAARGIEMSNPAIAAEAAARSGAVRQRQAEDLATATALNQAYTQDLMANRQFGTGLYGQEIGLQQANQQAALQAALANQQTGQNLSLANLQALNQAGQFNAGLGAEAAQFTANAANQAGQFGAAAQNQANLANQAALNQARMFGAEAGNQGQLTNAQLQAQYAMANQNAANQFALTNQAAGLDLNAQNRLFAANQQQQNIANLGLLGQAGTQASEANRAYALNLAQGYRGAAYDPTAMLLGQQSNAPQAAAQQQGYALNLAQTFNAPTTYNPDTGINLAMANQANITNKSIAETSAKAQLDAASKAASASKTAGALGGLGSIVGGALAGKVFLACIPEGEFIDTPNGQASIQSIRSGDIVTGFFGEPVKVLIKHEYAEDPEALRFYRIHLDNGGNFSVCDMHRIEGEHSMNYRVGDQFTNGSTIIKVDVYSGVNRSYDLLTEDTGYRMAGVSVNSMINELTSIAAQL